MGPSVGCEGEYSSMQSNMSCTSSCEQAESAEEVEALVSIYDCIIINYWVSEYLNLNRMFQQCCRSGGTIGDNLVGQHELLGTGQSGDQVVLDVG